MFHLFHLRNPFVVVPVVHVDADIRMSPELISRSIGIA